MDKQFEEGIEFGCMSAWIWYLLWFGLTFYVAAKTKDWMYVFGMLSCGLLVGLWLKNVVMVFLLKD
jgi:hypothetical protein